jgi:FkbH-like protein
MNIEELLLHLAENHCTIRADGERLSFRLPQSVDSKHLIEELRAHKTQLLHILQRLPSDNQLIAPIGISQRGIWFQHLIVPQEHCYNVAVCLRFDGLVEPERFREAAERVSANHDVLRTTYHHIDELTLSLQCVRKELLPSFAVIDGNSLGAEDISRLVQNIVDTPFDLANGPVWRISLINTPHQSSIVVLVIHHLACDAASLSLLFKELEMEYCENTNPIPKEYALHRKDYINHVAGELRLLASEKGRQLSSFWKTHLAGVPPISTLPPDKARPAIKRFDGESFSMSLSEKHYRAIGEYCANRSLPAAALFLYCLFKGLERNSKQSDLCVGMITSGRAHSIYRDVVGNFINTIPIRASLETNASIDESLDTIKRRMLEAIEMQDASFAFIVEEVRPPRSPDRTPIFQVLFNMVPAGLMHDLTHFVYGIPSTQNLLYAGMPAKPMQFQQQLGQFDLTLEAVECNGSYTLFFKYDSNVFQKQSIDHFAKEYVDRLHAIVHGKAYGEEPANKGIRGKKSGGELMVVSSFTIEPAAPYLRKVVEKSGLPLSLRILPSYQIFGHLLNPASELHNIQGGAAIIAIRPKDLSKAYNNTHIDRATLERDINDFAAAVRGFAEKVRVPLIVVVCPDGNLDRHDAAPAMEAAQSLVSMLKNISGIFVLPMNEVIASYGIKDWYDEVSDSVAMLPYTEEMYAALAAAVVRTAAGALVKPFKAIVVDCDGTLWDGVAAEDGPQGVRVNAHHVFLQQLLQKMRQEGKLICISSKNNEADVWEVFDKNNSMILSRTEIDFWRIDWNEKALNIKNMAAEIGISPDAMIFLDDNPVECSRAASILPELCTVQLPQKGEEWESFLRHLWCFDAYSVTREDRLRAESYRHQKQRADLQRSSGSFAEFIEKLELMIQIEDARPDLVPRISQLTWRTNQFNNSGIRRNENEIAALMNSRDTLLRIVQVQDRFGQYGYTGLVIAKQQEETLLVDTLLLSCRVLGRGVEHALCAMLGAQAQSLKCATVTIPCIETPRNLPIRKFIADLISSVGGVDCRDNKWVFDAAHLAKHTFNPAEIATQPEVVAATETTGDSAKGYVITPESYAEIARITASGEEILKACRTEQSADDNRARPSGSPVRSAAILEDTLERQLYGIWSVLLPDKEFGINDTFFDCGGTSLMLPRVCSEVKKLLGVTLTITDVMQSPTIASLAKQIKNLSEDHKDSTLKDAQVGRTKAMSAGVMGLGERMKQARSNLATSRKND